MLFCTKCKSLCENSSKHCPNCNSTKNLRAVNEDDFVFLHRADEYTAKLLTDDFDNYRVSYEVENFSNGRISYFYDPEIMPSDKSIYVKYSDYDMAMGISSSLKDKLNDENSSEEFDEMPKGKRIAVQVISVLLFLSLITVAVFFTDTIAQWLKDLITGLKK